jgi:riboflavin synthase
MFTGIIETMARVEEIRREGSNVHFVFSSGITSELRIDQSVAHNGVCLTVIKVDGRNYTVTAIDETMQRSNMGELEVGDKVNIERCMTAGGRFDGHIVQGHVDTTAKCTDVRDLDGSKEFFFTHQQGAGNITVQKGSITVNGVSLTVVHSDAIGFSVCIIPYTLEHTNFHSIGKGSVVNLEFDIIGKYVARLLENRK